MIIVCFRLRQAV